MLSDKQVESYRREGYVFLPGVVAGAPLDALLGEVARIADRARHMSENDDVIELEPGHSRERPRIQRIKAPHRFAFFREWLQSSGLLDAAARLIGPDMRFHSSKINMKGAGGGAPINWHQDWAFYPHTNDDILAIGVMLDDVDDDNGPLMIMPGTHTGEIFDHHGADYFTGSVDLSRYGLDPRDATRVRGPAGSVSIHHARTLHGSDANTSDRDRRVLFFELTAADAWPMAGTYSPFTDLEEYDQRMVAGKPCREPRMVALPVRVPQPKPPVIASIYEIQRKAAR